MRELTIEALVENITEVTEFIDRRLEELDCPMKAQMQIDVAVDELFGNIAQYAYKQGTGTITVRVEVVENPLSVVITFIDQGIPYDPLQKEDPDITLSAEEREIGGLGVFIVKKTMDEVLYEYKDGQNVLKIKKNLN
jgi:anti-sigma regulatory factor (Ser/Thr protein kinase)